MKNSLKDDVDDEDNDIILIMFCKKRGKNKLSEDTNVMAQVVLGCTCVECVCVFVYVLASNMLINFYENVCG